MSKPRKRRPYDASHRQQRALESRERVLDVARRLFAERGYAETTMADIATEAEIALPTLYASFQSKRGLLSGVLNRLVSGQPGGPPVLETRGARAVLTEPDARRALALLAADLTAIQERVGPIYDVMKNAARTETEVAELFARAQGNRYSNFEAVAARLAELGALRQGLTIEHAARTLWVLASPDVRQMLATYAGWPAEQYKAWLESVLTGALLPDPRPTRKRENA